ncbi:NAD(P)H-binding protein [Dactylosporangium darangshiense]|uniref:NAD(P)H-binding protein n=1 Tax=Dactylosporangium darangshiense TaxID=579108 RepID=A0ABP8DRN2_9ACTN
MIIVTGGNGPFGRAVINKLGTGREVAASLRDAGKAQALREQGVAVRQGDFGRPGTLTDAFVNGDVILINATYYGTAPDVRRQHMRDALEAAVAAGAKRIVVTSWQDAERSTIPSTADFPETERAVRELPVAWTIVRVGYGLAAALARDVIAGRRDGVLTAPAGDARLAVGATEDQGEAVARILAGEDGVHDHRTYDLTGPDTIGWEELAAMGGVEYRPETDADYRARSVANGFPPHVADQLLALYGSIRSGWAGTPTGDLAALLGRTSITASEAVRQAVAGWNWS